MSDVTVRTAGILLIILPTVAFGGTSILFLGVTKRSDYMRNPIRSRFWAAGHAHAIAVFQIILALGTPVGELLWAENIQEGYLER